MSIEFGDLYGTIFSMFAQSIATCYGKEIQWIRANVVNDLIETRLLRPSLILLLFLHLRLRLRLLLRLYHSLIIRIIGSVLRSGDTVFGVKSTQRSGSLKEQGLYSAKSSMKPRLRSVSVNQRPMEVVRSAVSIYV